MKGWNDAAGLGDEGYIRRAPDGSFFLLRIDDMWEATGDEDRPHYNVQVMRVDLKEVSDGDIDNAIQSCSGWATREELEEQVAPRLHAEVIAEMLASYGQYQPLDQFDGNRLDRVRAEARRCAEEYMRSTHRLDRALDRPVNKIGSTAREYGRGDLNAPLRRYQREPTGDPSMDILLKMHGGSVSPSKPAPRFDTVKVALATGPHAKCEAAGHCIEPVPDEEKCRP